jgi:DNA-binding NtrC family response regulator
MAYILIVDSQAQFRHQLVRLLESAGHQAAAVATITEAAGILQTQVPDLLATDVVLTDGSSTNLTEQAAALVPNCVSQRIWIVGAARKRPAWSTRKAERVGCMRR